MSHENAGNTPLIRFVNRQQMRERCGLRQFRCRGRVKATMEATWACLSYNLIRWFGLQRSLQAEAATIA